MGFVFAKESRRGICNAGHMDGCTPSLQHPEMPTTPTSLLLMKKAG
jgi:hypothetical protein